MPAKYTWKKTIILTLAIVLALILHARNNQVQRSLEEVKENCFIVKATMNGLVQWGNGVYYYLSVIDALLKNGATHIKLEQKPGVIPIGVYNLDGVAYGPKASENVNESTCTIIEAMDLITKYKGLMWDLMNLREQWDDMTKRWGDAVSASVNQNPFKTDFGVYPSLPEVTNTFGVNWEEVIVLHIRQGDVMKLVHVGRHLGHSQPPCAYYEDVIETGYNGGPFPYVLIITNKIKNRDPLLVNICDQYLEERYGSGEHNTKLLDYNMISDRLFTKDSHAGKAGQHEGLRKDLFILTQAVNVGEGHSTFTMGTTLFNYKLKRHFYPAAPATINTLLQEQRTHNGNAVAQRQFYLPRVEQTLYILDDWHGYDGSCKSYKDINGPFFTFVLSHLKLAEEWKEKNTNFTQELLNYNRSSIVKFKTSGQPFPCESVSMMKDNPSWYIPCICD